MNGVTPVHVPVTYSRHEKKTAKSVLDRLLQQAARPDITPVVPMHEEE